MEFDEKSLESASSELNTQKQAVEIREGSEYEQLKIDYRILIESNNSLKDKNIELETRLKAVEKANEEKIRFITNLSHDLRTPLNGITGITELLNNTSLNDEQRNYLEMLEASSEVLTDIIENVLDMTIIDSGKVKISQEVFDIKDNIENIVKQLSITGYKKNLKIMFYIEPFTETMIKGDRLKLNQVLINLVNNSIKYTENGHVFISVKKISEKNDKVKYQFSIEDTGIGIDDSIKDKLFDPYSQVDMSYAKKYSGTGLGLAISKKLVAMMDGEIWFDSAKGMGSTFYFTIEFSRANVVDSSTSAEKCVSGVEVESSKTPLIMVVEDNEINKKLASAFLNKRGYNNICVSNGQEAVEAYKTNDLDLILMDIQMPVLNGFEATKIIREEEKATGKHVPIITMTAYAMHGDREKCLAAGMDDYISKPINAEILYEKVGKFIKLSMI